MFPSFDKWKTDVLNPLDTHPWHFDTTEWYEYYRDKSKVARLVAPTRILEIGVRFGYSAHAFMSGAGTALYQGIDANDPKFGGWMEPTTPWALAMLRRNFPGCEIIIRDADTQAKGFRVQDLYPGMTYDLVHVDADHEYWGCMHDLQSVYPVSTNAILVDDYEECPTVKRAVQDFCRDNPVMLFTSYSVRGEALILV